MKIAVGSDHGGLKLKNEIKKYLTGLGHIIKDFGTDTEQSCDYPDFAYPAAEAVAKGECEKGILFCGSGVGVSIVANKVPGIRAVNAMSVEIAKQSREHGDANVLTLGGKYVSVEDAKNIVDVWLKTPFSGDERHLRRIKKIERK